MLPAANSSSLLIGAARARLKQTTETEHMAKEQRSTKEKRKPKKAASEKSGGKK
ncbi:MAG: hypothetical protein ACRCS9_07540 [Hyphomicrobium sp.]